MRILSRYLLREHRGPFLFALGALTGLMLLNQIAKQFGNLIGKGLPWWVIVEVFALSLPFMLAMTVPMAVLVAVLQAFSRLGADSEITALKASGVHLVRLVLPVVLAGALVSVGVFVFVDQVLPRSNHKLKTLLVDIARKRPTFELKEQTVNEVSPGQLFLRAGRIDQASDRMQDVVIYDLANEARRRTIYADSGYVRYNSDRTDLHLTLFDGYMHDYDATQATTFRRVFFRTDLVRVRGVSNRLERTMEDSFRGDREMSVCEMEDIVRSAFAGVASIGIERRRAVEADAYALAGTLPPAPRDTAAPDARQHTVTAYYCRLVARVRSLLVPATLAAQEPAAALPPGGAAPAQPRARTRMVPDAEGAGLRGQLATLAAREAAARQHAASFQVEIHKKFSLAISCLVFVIIGAPVALRFPRGGTGLVIAASVMIFGLYYIGLIGGETFADRMLIPPFWAMWGPNVLMTAIGLVLFSRLGREHVTARGEGWEGLSRVLERRRAGWGRR